MHFQLDPKTTNHPNLIRNMPTNFQEQYQLLEQTKQLLKEHDGHLPVELLIHLNDGNEVLMELPQRVAADETILSQLERIFGDSVVELH